MVDKKYFFMSGLQRSGGTLLSAILNQNPDIYASAESPVCNMLFWINSQHGSKHNLDVNRFEDIENVMKNVLPSFYENYSQKYIFDKNFVWTDIQFCLFLKKFLKNDIRIICPVRNVMEILASFNRICESDKNNEIDRLILKNDKTEKDMPDKRADWFMGSGSASVLPNLKRLQGIMMSEFKNSVLFVDYDDLIFQPRQVLDKIYSFLNIEKFNHNFEQIDNSQKFTDAWGIKDLHYVNSTIKKREYNLESIFSAKTIEKYSGLEFWKDIT